MNLSKHYIGLSSLYHLKYSLIHLCVYLDKGPLRLALSYRCRSLWSLRLPCWSSVRLFKSYETWSTTFLKDLILSFNSIGIDFMVGLNITNLNSLLTEIESFKRLKKWCDPPEQYRDKLFLTCKHWFL